MNMFRHLANTLVVGAALSQGSAAMAEWICWSADRSGRIECAAPDGSGRFDLFTGLNKPQGLAVDAVHGRLYWSEHDTHRVATGGLVVGAAPSTIVELPIDAGPRGMAVASSVGKVYWVAETLAKIQRANLDGTGVEDLSLPPGSFFDVEVDDTSGMLYWTDGTQIWRGNLDGTSATSIISGLLQPYYLALDLAAGKIYWTDFAANEIGRANLDGTQREIPAPITGLVDRPVGIALNPVDGKVYWTLDSGAVQRANVDGSNVETVLGGLESTWDIAFVAAMGVPDPIPAASTWGLVSMAIVVFIAGTLLLSHPRRDAKVRPDA